MTEPHYPHQNPTHQQHIPYTIPYNTIPIPYEERSDPLTTLTSEAPVRSVSDCTGRNTQPLEPPCITPDQHTHTEDEWLELHTQGDEERGTDTERWRPHTPTQRCSLHSHTIQCTNNPEAAYTPTHKTTGRPTQQSLVQHPHTCPHPRMPTHKTQEKVQPTRTARYQLDRWPRHAVRSWTPLWPMMHRSDTHRTHAYPKQGSNHMLRPDYTHTNARPHHPGNPDTATTRAKDTHKADP